MVRKAVFALIAVVALGLLSPTNVSARGGHSSGGFHSGIAVRRLPFGAAPGLYPPYAYGFPYYGPDAYPYDYEYHNDASGCFVEQRLVHTRHGTWFRPVEVCG